MAKDKKEKKAKHSQGQAQYKLAQQLVKLFRYDKARLKRVTNVLERYVEEKRKSIRKSTVYGYRDYYAHWDGSLSCVSGAFFLVIASTASRRPRLVVRRRRDAPFPSRGRCNAVNEACTPPRPTVSPT